MENSKHFISKITLIIVIQITLAIVSIQAQDGFSTDPTNSNSVKLIKEIIMPDKINKCTFIKMSDSTSRLWMILARDGIYKVNENFQPVLYKPSLGKLENTLSMGFIGISKDEKIAVEDISVGSEDSQTIVWNLESGEYKRTKAYGASVMSDDSILTSNGMCVCSYFLDFSGQLLRACEANNCIINAKPFCSGFIGTAGDLQFWDSQGNCIKYVDLTDKNFSVDYETGVTIAVGQGTANMPLRFFKANGELIFEVTLPFAGFHVGLGISPGGKYAVVTCREASIVMLFDIEQKKEIWSKSIRLGYHFSNWSNPIPTSTDANYIVINAILGDPEKDNSVLVILDRQSNVIGTIKDSEYGNSNRHHIEFIPGVKRFIHYDENILKIYEFATK